MTTNPQTHVIVIGAGYAGMMAALRLAGRTRRQNVAVTLVNALDVFIQRPRLHEVATNQPVPEVSIHDMLRGTRVNFQQGWVAALDPKRRALRVETPHGAQEMTYDYLMYALGSVVDRDSVPGVRDHAYTLDARGSQSATELRLKLVELANRAGRVVVVGGGATGIEGATEIKGLYPALQVSLVTQGRFGAFKGARVEPHLREAFQQQGIPIHEHKTVTAVEAGRLVTADGDAFPFDVCVWAGGFRPLPLAREAGLAVNKWGQILVDPYGRSISHPEIYAVGDASHPVEESGVPMRMSLLTAVTRGAHAADNLNAVMRGGSQKPLSFAYYGQGIAMGPNDAVGFAAFPDDKPIGPIVRGRWAVWIRDFFVRLIFYFLELERRWPGFYFWIGQGRYAAAKRAASQRRASAT